MNFEKYEKLGWNSRDYITSNTVTISKTIESHWVIVRKIWGISTGDECGIIIGRTGVGSGRSIWFKISSENFLTVLLDIIIDHEEENTLRGLIDLVSMSSSLHCIDINTDELCDLIFEGDGYEL